MVCTTADASRAASGETFVTFGGVWTIGANPDSREAAAWRMGNVEFCIKK
jgi:hypothetical protein